MADAKDGTMHCTFTFSEHAQRTITAMRARRGLITPLSQEQVIEEVKALRKKIDNGENPLPTPPMN